MNDRFTPENPSHLKLARPALALFAALLGWLAPHRANATVAATPAPVASETEFKALQARDAVARQEMSRWLRDAVAHDDHLADKSPHFLSARIEHRLGVVSAAYAGFIARHPEHPTAAALEASFRAEITDDLDAIRRWEEDLQEDPDSPTPWNELAHYLTHNGRTVDGFMCFEKSVSLGSDEAVYLFDYGTALLLYRPDAISHYKLTEQEVFARVLSIYRRGLRLEPDSFRFAAEYAQAFYLIKPARPAEGLAAWHDAAKVAVKDGERDEAHTHLARYAIHAGHLNLARIYLDQVKDPRLEPVKESLLRRINDATKPQKVEAPPASE